MLVIRDSQMDVFNAAVRRTFEDEMVLHLSEFSPPLFKAIGEHQMRSAIRFGVSRAEKYGFTLRGPVRLYLESMLLFGSNFDSDPQYAWALTILNDRDAYSQMQRAERLYAAVMDYRETVTGLDDAFTLQALSVLRLIAQKPLELTSEDLVVAMRSTISRVYPRKAAYVGAEGIDALIHKALAVAGEQHFSSARGAALVVVLMLAFGHGCFDDPLYPWIGRTLKDERIADPEARAGRLERKSLTWLDHALINLDQVPQT